MKPTMVVATILFLAGWVFMSDPYVLWENLTKWLLFLGLATVAIIATLSIIKSFNGE
jgi:ABC-type multidrug transport system permease subunit